MNDAGFGNKRIAISQRRYLGSKTKLLEFIDEILSTEKVTFTSIADIFAGTGVVAAHNYHKSSVIVNDILESNYLSYLAYFGKERIRKTWLTKKLSEYNSLDPASLKNNYFSENFANTYFDENNSKLIGFIREDIEKEFYAGNCNQRERAYLITALMYAFDRIANTVGHYDAYRKLATIPSRKLELKPLHILSSKHKAAIYKMDANQLVRKVKADVVYIDPPYNSRQYSDSYHLLENIAEWKKLPVEGVAKKIDRSHLKSSYSLKSANYAFSDLIENIDAKYILVSYNDMGTSGDARSQSRISDHELVSALERRGMVTIYEKSFNQFTTGKSNKTDLKERVFFCRVANKKSLPVIIPSEKNTHAPLFVKSPLNYTGGKHKLLPQISSLWPDTIDHFYDVFCGAANVGINAKAHKITCIDSNEKVIEVLNLIKETNFEEINQQIITIIETYGLSQSYLYSYNFYNAESSKGLGAFNKSPYKKLRDSYNSTQSKNKALLLLVLILYGFNNQIRFNSKGEFNLPVGKRDYNGSSRKNIANFNAIANKKDVQFQTGDFRSIKKRTLGKDDFIYLDPPYLLGLASYNESNGWTLQDEKDLYETLSFIHKKGSKFALSNVIEHKGKVNQILKSWAEREKFTIHPITHHYKNSNYQSNAKNNITKEVLITNY